LPASAAEIHPYETRDSPILNLPAGDLSVQKRLQPSYRREGRERGETCCRGLAQGGERRDPEIRIEPARCAGVSRGPMTEAAETRVARNAEAPTPARYNLVLLQPIARWLRHTRGEDALRRLSDETGVQSDWF